MAAGKSVWAIDIGNNSLKALRLQQAGENIEVIGLEYIEHPKILSAEGITEEEKNKIIRAALNTFAQRNELGKDPITISVPGQTSFARFIKLPPVELKRVPQIVKFEAVQQIPFDINEVEWDWQLMTKKDSPDTEVGIFAIKNELIGKYLENFSAENIRVSYVQMAPIALYNYAVFDRKDLDNADKNAVVLLDMGADNTNLVVCTKSGVWQRCIPLGGNNFTKTISETFKLNFEKAEKLKRGAPLSKYARQIYHTMKPVLTDIGTEIQRSLGYYSSSHKNTSFTKIISLGGGLKLPGLNKYLQQTTQIPTVRPDAFERLLPAQNISSAKLHENICDFAIAYGLGVQALNIAKIQTNLLPAKIARSMMWAQKSKFFTAAAVILLVASVLALLRASIDFSTCSSATSKDNQKKAQLVLQLAKNEQNSFNLQKSQGNDSQRMIEKYLNVFQYRDVIPLINEMVLKTIPNKTNNPAQAELYEAYAKGDVDKIKQIPRNQRKQVFITSIGVNYAESLASAPLETAKFESIARSARSTEAMRTTVPNPTSGQNPQNAKGFVVVIEGYTPYDKIGELLDPVGVGADPNKWGIVTRMLNLDKLFDSNSPFELYDKNKIENFRIEMGLVDPMDQQMPAGIGVEQTLTRASAEDIAAESKKTSKTKVTDADLVAKETVILDPLTKEEISRIFDIDDKGHKKYDSFGQPLYIERDKWFRIRAKFIWKNAAEQNPPGTGR